MTTRKTKIAVGLSGGVDSSVAAALLHEQGHEVIGIIMEIFDGSVGVKESARHACYGPGEKGDVEAAASVCHTFGIPFHVIDLKKEYRSHVLEYFRGEYLAGRTPNPCIVCNQRLSKDQTYFLYALTQKQILQTIFPLGGYTKQQVRKIAGSLGLETAIRPESQDFIAGGDYSPLFNDEEIEEGDIVDEKGNIIGKHRGIIHYTVGQRKGLGIASGRPLYVLKIDAHNNRIVVSDRESLFSEGLIAKDLNLIAMKTLDLPHDVQVKIRINHTAADATLFPHERSKARILFKEPQMALTPGQSAVFYSGDTVLGGGVIEKAF
ncbi:MAG: tRNA 2-thiouridine(34) synthase MnmA [Deltaproteobacteria bacterium]|nr:tRNA 2-thiouridine(34) synthase MnmA [Deltaproteobacteria bacterium]